MVALLFAIPLIILLYCAEEHFVNSNSHAPGLADCQGIAALLVLLYWTGWNSSVNSHQRDSNLWTSPYESRDTSKRLWPWISLSWNTSMFRVMVFVFPSNHQA